MRQNVHIRQDSLKRSIAKAITWRVLGTLDTFILSFLVITHLPGIHTQSLIIKNADVATAASLIAATEVITKLVLFTLHEQGWTRIGWGRPGRASITPELKRRSLVKTGTWRVLAMLDTSFLAWLFTGSVAAAFTIGALEVMTKMALYYGHERIWLKIKVV